MNKKVSFVVNDKIVEDFVDDGITLLRYLRDQLKLTGTKDGCSNGHCGSCTVLTDGMPKKSCLVKMGDIEGKKVITVEGLSKDGRLDPLQEAFLNAGAIQCGFCTPGMLMAAKGLLLKNQNPTEEEIKDFMAGNLCRCTGYIPVIKAVKSVARGSYSRQSGDKKNKMMVGISPIEKEGPEKVSGSLLFGDDLYFDGMLYGKLLLSEYPHARIVGVNTEEAERVPGVVKVLTGKDVPGPNRYGRYGADQPILADDVVKYIGSVIVVCFAETRDKAEEAIKLVKVEYQPLPAVFDPEKAMEPGAVKLNNNNNICKQHVIQHGDVDAAFSRADLVVKEYYYTPFVDHAYMEPEAGVGLPTEGGGVEIYYPAQAPHNLRDAIAENLLLAPDQVRVRATPLGGAFGGKNDEIVPLLLGLGAHHTGRPVKITLTRQESLRMHSKRHAFKMWYETAVCKDGTLLGIKIKILADAGAYTTLSPSVLGQATSFSAGPYCWPNVHIESFAVLTNNVPAGAFRGFGTSQVHFAVETQMDIMAEKLGIDPLKFRFQNALHKGKRMITGEIMRFDYGFKSCIQKAMEERDKLIPFIGKGKNIGIGVACGHKNIGIGKGFYDIGGAILELTVNGEVLVRPSAVEMGQGVTTVLAQIASSVLGVDYDLVKVINADTALVPEKVIGVSQRQTYVAGNSVIKASSEFKKKILFAAAKRLGCSPDHLDISGDMVIGNGNGISLKDLAEYCAANGYKVESMAEYMPPPTSTIEQIEKNGEGLNYFSYTFLSQVALVEVEEATGRTKILKIITVPAVGSVLNPHKLRGQLEGASVMGIGYALSEIYRIENGINVTKTLRGCGIPTYRETPDEIIIFPIEDKEEDGPFGARAVGEVAIVPTAPAITNAIYNAVGVRFYSLPATPQQMLVELKKQGE